MSLDVLCKLKSEVNFYAFILYNDSKTMAKSYFLLGCLEIERALKNEECQLKEIFY